MKSKILLLRFEHVRTIQYGIRANNKVWILSFQYLSYTSFAVLRIKTTQQPFLLQKIYLCYI